MAEGLEALLRSAQVALNPASKTLPSAEERRAEAAAAESLADLGLDARCRKMRSSSRCRSRRASSRFLNWRARARAPCAPLSSPTSASRAAAPCP